MASRRVWQVFKQQFASVLVERLLMEVNPWRGSLDLAIACLYYYLYWLATGQLATDRQDKYIRQTKCSTVQRRDMVIRGNGGRGVHVTRAVPSCRQAELWGRGLHGCRHGMSPGPGALEW